MKWNRKGGERDQEIGCMKAMWIVVSVKGRYIAIAGD